MEIKHTHTHTYTHTHTRARAHTLNSDLFSNCNRDNEIITIKLFNPNNVYFVQTETGRTYDAMWLS